MQRALFGAAISLALITPALAGKTIPADFHGEWCSLNDTYYVQRSVVDLYRKQGISDSCSKDSDGWIKITADHYDGHEQWCKPVNVAKLPPPQRSAITLKLKCVGDDEKFNLTVELWRTPGSGGGSWIKRLYIQEKTK